jgi:hypothetical protein
MRSPEGLTETAFASLKKHFPRSVITPVLPYFPREDESVDKTPRFSALSMVPSSVGALG